MGLCNSKASSKPNAAGAAAAGAGKQPPNKTKFKKKTRKSTPEERYAAYKAPKELMYDGPGGTYFLSSEGGAMGGGSRNGGGLLDPFESTDATTSSSAGGEPTTGSYLVQQMRLMSRERGLATMPPPVGVNTPSTIASGAAASSIGGDGGSTNSVNSPYYWNTTNALVPIATARKGRALQSRLEKAKQMQLVLSHTSSSGDGGDDSPMVVVRDSKQRPTAKNIHGGGTKQRKISLNAPASAVALSANGTMIYVGTDDGRILIFGTTTTTTSTTPTNGGDTDAAAAADPFRSVQLSSRPIKDICILPPIANGSGSITSSGGDENHHRHSRIAVAVDDYCRILDGTTLATLHSIRHDDRVYALSLVKMVQRGQPYLAIAGFSSTVNFYNADTLEYERHIERPYGLILAMDAWGDWLAIAGSDKTCAVFTTGITTTTTTTAMTTNTPPQQQPQLWDLSYEIRRPTTILAVAWSATKHLAIASKDAIGVFLDRSLLYELTVHGTTGLAWSPSGRYLCAVAPHHSGLYAGSQLRHSFVSSSTSSSSSPSPFLLSSSSVSSSTDKDNNNEPYVAVAWGQWGTLVLAGETELQILRAGETTVDDASLSTASYFSNRGDWVLKEDAFRDLDEPPPVIQQAPVERNIVALAFSKGSKFRPSSYLAVSSGDANHLVVVRNGTDYSLVAELEFPATVACLTFSHGSRYLALGCHDAHVYIYDTTATWELVTKIEFSDPISALSFTVRNERLFVGSIDGTVAYLNVEQEFDFEDEIEGYESGVTSLDCSAKHFAAGRDEGIVTVFDIDKLDSPVAELHRDSPVTTVCFGVSSRFLAVGDAEGLVGVYSAKGGWVLSNQIEMDNSICVIRWCAQGRHLAVSDVAGSIKVYDTIFWQEIGAARQPRSTSGSKYLDFSQDGKYLAFGSDRVTVLETANNWKPVLGSSSSSDNEDDDGR